MPTSLNAVRIILVEPAGTRNIGSVARVMKNMGLLHLTLVNPQCDHLDEEAQHMAVHAKELLEAAQVVQTLPEGLVGCRRAIATLGRPYAAATPEHLRDALPWLVETDLANSTALIFGPEDRGLSNDELSYAHRFITIPANPVYPSLNLAQAVGICCYELHEAVRTPQIKTFQPCTPNPILPTPNFPSAPINEIEGFYQHLESLLLTIGYLQPHTASSRMKKFRRLFNRAMPSSEDVTMLRGILSQMQWATKVRSQDSEKEG
ncbi:RNA methyltransferase [Phormidium sp. CLA17]|nr:RNA methyltransferase [Leptolyngbya sp. Cla-17]